MSELFDTIEKRAQEQAERERAAFQQLQAEQKRANHTKRKKATVSVALRLLISGVLCVAMSLAGRAGLMDTTLIRAVYAAMVAWIAFWLGAWAQFIFCKGGLLQ